MAPAVMDGSDGEIVDEGVPVLLVIQQLDYTGLACMAIMKMLFSSPKRPFQFRNIIPTLEI